MIFRFGRYELDEEAAELRCDGEPVAVQPKPLALLALLLRERDRVVSLDELFDALWPGVAVTPSSLTRAVSHARRAIGDTHVGERIRSHARRGYRFVGEVEATDRRGAHASAAPAAPAVPEPAAVAVPARAGARESAPFIGRGDALARLAAAWQDAEAGSGALAIVSGPPGIGKTRLAEVFVADASRRGGRVVVARCREGEGVPAFWPWAQVLRSFLADESLREEALAFADGFEELRSLVPELAGAATPPAARPDPPTEHGRFVLFDAVARAIARASLDRPLLLVIEDVQWAGAPSLRLLEHLAFESADARLLVLATVREAPREASHPVDRVLGLLRPLPRCTSIALESFTRAEVATLLERTIGRPAPADLTSELYARTEGVPLFVREAIRLLAERGELRRPERAPRGGIRLPDSALDLLRRTLDGLAPLPARVVSAASVLGREFALPLVADLAECSRVEALGALDEASHVGVVEPVENAEASHRFGHALFQETAYASLPAVERARLHLRAAELLERRHAADPDRVIAELAHHHHRALAVGDPERAFACAKRAAERAAAVLAWEQAAAHGEQALAALDHADVVDPLRRLDTLLALGDAYRLAGDRTRRREAFTRAFELARAQGRPRELARAAIGLCEISEWSVRDDSGRAAVDEAIAALGGEPSAETARLATRKAYLVIRVDEPLAARHARRALELARDAGDPEALQEALYALHFSIAGPDGLDERERLVRELVETATSSTGRDVALIGLLDAACDRITQGDGAGARRLRAEASALAGERPTPTMTWHLRVYDTGAALLEGRFDEVPGLAAAGREVGRRIGHPYAGGCFHSHLAERLLAMGELEEAERRLARLARPGMGPMHYLRAACARAQLALGREAEARSVFEEIAADGFSAIPRNIRWTRAMVEIAHLCADLGDARRAEELVDLLAPSAHLHGCLGVAVSYGGSLAEALGRLANLRGRSDDSDGWFEEAVESTVALGARPRRALALAAWGAAALRRGDRRAARPRLEEAHALASELGMQPTADAAVALLSPGVGARGAAGPGS